MKNISPLLCIILFSSFVLAEENLTINIEKQIPKFLVNEEIKFFVTPNVNEVEWNFGNGKLERRQSSEISQTYLVEGVYKVTAKSEVNGIPQLARIVIKVEDIENDESDNVAKINVKAINNDGQAPLPTSFIVSYDVTESGIEVKKVVIDYGDEKTEQSTVDNFNFFTQFTHIYEKVGAYQAKITATFVKKSPSFKEFEKEVNVIVFARDEKGSSGLDFEILTSQTKIKEDETLTLSILNKLSEIKEVKWSYDSSECLEEYCITGNQITIKFESSGIKTIKAVGFDSKGTAIRWIEKEIIVESLPAEIEFTLIPKNGVIVAGDKLILSAKLKKEKNGVFFRWNFGEGICLLCKLSNAGEKIQHIYRQPGIYKVNTQARLKIPLLSDIPVLSNFLKLSNNLSDKTVPIVVKSKKSAPFLQSVDNGNRLANVEIIAKEFEGKDNIEITAPKTIVFLAKHNFPDINPYIEWNFGDEIKNTENAVYTFTGQGRQIVSLTIKKSKHGKIIGKDLLVVNIE